MNRHERITQAEAEDIIIRLVNLLKNEKDITMEVNEKDVKLFDCWSVNIKIEPKMEAYELEEILDSLEERFNDYNLLGFFVYGGCDTTDSDECVLTGEHFLNFTNN